MRLLAWTLLLLSCLLLTSGREPSRRVIGVSNAGELAELFAAPLDNVIVELAPGRYELTPAEALEPSTSYCGDNSALVPASVGLTMSGRRLTLRGRENGEAIIVVNASHGIYLKDCQDCEVQRLTVTGLAQGYTGNTAYGAIVARNSRARISDCLFKKNNVPMRPSDSHERGPGAISGLDGADLTIEFNELVGNPVCIDLHAGSRAVVRNNLIEGSGSGVGLSMRCNAIARVERNHIRRVFTGLQLAGGDSLVCRANIIEVTYAAISAASEEALYVQIEKNVIYQSGSGMYCGPVTTTDTQGVFTGRVSSNIVVETERPVVAANPLARVKLRNNTFFESKVDTTKDVAREAFWRARRPWTRTYRNTPVGVDGRHKFHESEYLQKYGRWLH